MKIVVASKKLHRQSLRIMTDEPYEVHVAMTKDETQRHTWTFHEDVQFESNSKIEQKGFHAKVPSDPRRYGSSHQMLLRVYENHGNRASSAFSKGNPNKYHSPVIVFTRLIGNYKDI